MVLQKRLDYIFNGYEAQAIPRETRSTRRRAIFQRRVEDDQLCAFDLLATVADKLVFQDKKDPTMPNGMSTEKDQHGFIKECQDANKPLGAELSGIGNCNKTHLSSQTNIQNCCLKEFQHSEIGIHSGIAPGVASTGSSERYVAEKLADGGKSQNKIVNFNSKDKLDSSGYPEDSYCKLDGDTIKVKDELHMLEVLPVVPGTKIRSFEDPLGEKPPAPISLGGNSKLCQDDSRIPCSSFSKGCDDVPVVSRDDDENFSGFTHPITKTNSFRPMKTCIDDGRIRKLSPCKYHPVSHEPRDDTLCKSDGDLKPTYHIKKNCYKRQRCQMNVPLKKRKWFNYSSVSNSNRIIRSGDIYYSPENGMNQDASGSTPEICEDPGMPSLEGHHSTLPCRDDRVNIRVKSFRVPEIFIEIPETATIGSLKRTVMNAVTAVLGGGLSVGVSLKGKKVRDDSKTLIQTGISHDKHMDALGFTLEPNISQSLTPVGASQSPHFPCADMPGSLKSPVVTHQRCHDSSDMLPENQVTSLSNLVESDYDSTPFPINASADKVMTDSKELVVVPELGKEEVAVLPVVQKSKHSESLQRRIRRPFSVEEVEALVQAVEKLGTGRWRDIKHCAFDNADHRTYVDLKDKWKTLVHTARISPQQRRGEPVPQELLDRVLTAHAYWSHQQTTLLFNKGYSTSSSYVDGVTA